MRIYIEAVIVPFLLAAIAWKIYANREWKDPDKVVDEFCGMEDLNRYHIQHHHRDMLVIVGMAATMAVLMLIDIFWIPE